MKKIEWPSLILVLLIFLGGFTNLSWGCKVIPPPETLFFFASYERALTNFYGKSNYTEINNCNGARASKNKYLMIGIGPDHLTENYGVVNSYTGTIGDDKCYISGQRFKKYYPFAEKATYYQEKAKLVNTCFRTVVEDLANARIEYPKEQKFCQVTQVADNRVILAGSLCFLKPNARTTYRINHFINPDCAKRDFLRREGINPKDVYTGINYYKAGDASGDSTELDFLGQIRARISIDAGSELMELSEVYSDMSPRWPTTWAPDIHFAKIEARASGTQSTQLDLSFLVDNNCKEKCVDGLCSSPCEYSQPIAAEVTLSELSGGKKIFMDSWFHGGVALPRWQGIMKPISKYLDNQLFEKDHLYEAEIVFRDPYDDYYALFHSVAQFLVDLAGIQSGIPGLSNIPSLPGLSTLRNLPTLPSLPGLGADPSTDYATQDLQSRLENLTRYLGIVEWPPFYEKFASSDLTASKNSTVGENIKITVTFKVKDVVDGNVIIDNYSVVRSSPIVENYHIDNYTPIEFVCE